jgi:hypothetical protein
MENEERYLTTEKGLVTASFNIYFSLICGRKVA